LRVLVVDDDPTLRLVIRLVLERGGYEIDEAPHGKAALEAMTSAVPDVVVADMRMPVMSGLELIHRMRAEAATERVPVILLTGVSDVGDMKDLASAVLIKPFEPAHLLSTVGELISDRS
jgi:CheY-like chemotaxis protein